MNRYYEPRDGHILYDGKSVATILPHQVIEQQKEAQALIHNNTVFAQLLKRAPRYEFESLARQHHERGAV